jgi:hypothetical protein
MATTGKGRAEDEMSMGSLERMGRKDSPWVQEKEGDGGFQIGKKQRRVNRPRLYSFLFTGKERGRLFTAQCEHASTGALRP